MKKIFSLFLTLTLLLQTISSVGLLTGYFLNQKYIAEYLCINKQKPQLHCNGKCYLKKQLEENNNTDSKLPVQKNDYREVILFFEKSFSEGVIFPDKQKTYASYQFEEGASPLSDIFHPPKYC